MSRRDDLEDVLKSKRLNNSTYFMLVRSVMPPRLLVALGEPPSVSARLLVGGGPERAGYASLRSIHVQEPRGRSGSS